MKRGGGRRGLVRKEIGHIYREGRGRECRELQHNSAHPFGC